MPIDIIMPRLSDTMESGTIIKWNVKEGDQVSAGDIIADIETDKATMEMQVFEDGTIASIAIEEGKSVEIGTVIAILAEDDEDTTEIAAANGQQVKRVDQPTDVVTPTVVKPSDQPTAAPNDVVSRVTVAMDTDDGRRKISPVAQRLADEHGINIRSIQGSGPGGRIIKRDVLNAVKTGVETAASIPPSATPKPLATVTPVRVVATQPESSIGLQSELIPLSNMRQIIARRLVESKQTIPHYQVTISFDMDSLMELRSTLNQQLEAQQVKLSVNDFLVRACGLAMHQHPEFNSSWAGDSIQINSNVNIGIAIALPPERGGGLVVATIRDADQKSLRTISAQSKQLSEKARTRGLSIEEMTESTFTISNLGMFGVEHFTAIINPPNSAILAVGAAIQKPVVRDGELTVGYEMAATLSLDHRIIDGAMAAQYLQTLRQFLENPATLLV